MVLDLGDMALSIVILGIIVSIGATVLINVRNTDSTYGTTACGTNSTGGSGGTILYTACGTAYNVTDEAAIGLGEYGNWFKIIVIVAVAAVILGLIFSAFGGNRGAAPATY